MVTERLVSALVLSISASLDGAAAVGAASRREVVELCRTPTGKQATRTLSASHYLLQKIIDKNTEIYIC